MTPEEEFHYTHGYPVAVENIGPNRAQVIRLLRSVYPLRSLPDIVAWEKSLTDLEVGDQQSAEYLARQLTDLGAVALARNALPVREPMFRYRA